MISSMVFESDKCIANNINMTMPNIRRNIFHTLTIICLGLCGTQVSQAQTDAMFTKYMFNTLSYNPAYAGSKEHLSLNLIHRTQWMGVKGAPHSQTFTIHSPVKGISKLGIGASIINQNIGTSMAITANLSYAYRIKFGDSPYAGTLSIGMQGGMTNWRANLSDLDVYNGSDEAFGEEFPSLWLPNFGAGIYYSSKYYFVGASSPNILQHDLRKEGVTSERNARTFRHYYFTAGGAIPLKGKDLILKPVVLLKSAAALSHFVDKGEGETMYGTPTEFSFDLSLFIMEKIWVGAAYRSAIEDFTGTSSFDSADLWMAYYLDNGLNVGVAYDYTLTGLQRPSKASFEVMLGYDFNYSKSKVYSPRYF